MQHGPVDDFGQGFLGIIGNGGTDGVRFVSAAKEPSLAAAKGGDDAFGRELVNDPMVPFLVRGECVEIHWLKSLHYFNGEFTL